MLSKPPETKKKPKPKYRYPGKRRKNHNALFLPSVPNNLFYSSEIHRPDTYLHNSPFS
jgi:hypothetical protein